MNDSEILDLYWSRSENAIAATAEKYENYCRAISYHILGNDEDAKECVNDTWLNAWNSIPPKRPERLSAYLGKITRNLSLNRFKHYTAQKRGLGQTELVLSELSDCIASAGSVEESVEENVLAQSIEQFLYAKPRQKRSIFIRRYWYLQSIKEIADTYGMSESKLKSLLFRMRKELQIHLEKEGITL